MELGPGIFLPLRVSNPLNNRKHWRFVAGPAQKARNTVLDAVRRRLSDKSLPVTVIMTRIGPRRMDEGCGLNASLKPVRDGVAEAFEVDDADPGFTWLYRQELAAFFGVRIQFQENQ